VVLGRFVDCFGALFDSQYRRFISVAGYPDGVLAGMLFAPSSCPRIFQAGVVSNDPNAIAPPPPTPWPTPAPTPAPLTSAYVGIRVDCVILLLTFNDICTRRPTPVPLV
jgi:hypothetical protein